MIALIDSWGELPPPPGAADDDDLFAATGADAGIIIGDQSGRQRAAAMGIRIVQHIGFGTRFGTRPSLLARRQIRSQLPHHAQLVPLSIWTAGIIGRPMQPLPEPAPQHARPAADAKPFVLPLASDPKDVDAVKLVLAAALIEAAGGSCLMGLPLGLSNASRARRMLAASDRIVPVEALAKPAPAYIDAADVLLDVGLTKDGPIATRCATSDAPVVDALAAATPMSIAVALRRALAQAAPA